MGKLTNYLWVMGGLVILFYVSGIAGSVGGDAPTFLNLLINWKDMDTSSLVTTVIVAFAALAVGGFIAIGYSAGVLEKVAIYTLTVVLLGFGWDFLVVAKTLANQCLVCGWIATLIFAPFLIMFVISVVEWWRGDYT